MNRQRCYELETRAQASIQNFPFRLVEHLANCLGFKLGRIGGSHHLYESSDSDVRLNFQPRPDKTAKPYQLRQLLKSAKTSSKGAS